MISAERMKSVRIAPATFSSSSAWRRRRRTPHALHLRAHRAAPASDAPFRSPRTEEHATDHQQRCYRPRSEGRKEQGYRQQEQDLIFQRAPRDPSDDRQFAFGCETHHVSGRNGGVVDHDTGCRSTRLDDLPGDIVERGCSTFVRATTSSRSARRPTISKGA